MFLRFLTRRPFAPLALMTGALLAAPGTEAEFARSSLAGSVNDGAGLALPRVTVTVTNADPAASSRLAEGQEALRDGDWAAAVAAFRAEAAERPQSSETHRLLGSALRLGGGTDEAREPLERAVALDPENALAWTALGDLEAELGNWEAAATALETALGLAPGDRDLRFRQGARS